MGEFFVGEYLCKGYIDGCVVCILMVLVCLGKLNGVVLSFVSGIICELLLGEEVICLVEVEIELWLVLLC